MEDRLFKPSYIPFFLILRQKPFEFTYNTVIIYGFIVFYLKHTKALDFYFTDDQICQVLDMNPKDVQIYLRTLSENKFIYRFTKFNPKLGKRSRFIVLDENKHRQIIEGQVHQKGGYEVHQKGGYNKNIFKILNKEKTEEINLFEDITDSDSLPLPDWY